MVGEAKSQRGASRRDVLSPRGTLALALPAAAEWRRQTAADSRPPVGFSLDDPPALCEAVPDATVRGQQQYNC